MISLLDFFADLSNPALAFLPRAIIIAVLSAMVCGLVGVHVVLRGMSFIGDAVAHAVFPGIAIAFVLHASLLLGGAIAGVTVAVCVALLAANRRVKEDSLIGILLAAFFAVGLVVISRVNGYTASLTSFLFGSLTGVSVGDIIAVAVTAVVVTAVVVVFHHAIVAVSLDKESAAALGLPVLVIDIIVYAVTAAAVVISVQTVGNILVLALLVTPAATARLVTHSVTMMLIISPIIGAVGSFVGIYFAWAADVPTGAAIVLTVATMFVVTWAASLAMGYRPRGKRQAISSSATPVPALPARNAPASSEVAS